MNTPENANPGAGQPVDERYRTTGLLALKRLTALIRMGRAYQVDNQVFLTQMKDFMKALEDVIEEAGEAVLVTLESDFYLNGVRIPVKASTLKFHEAALEELRRRGIAGMKIVKGATHDEMVGFFRLFMEPDVYHGSGLLEACLAQGVDRVIPAVHATTEAAGTDGGVSMGFSSLRGGSGGEDVAGAGEFAGGPVSGEVETGGQGAPRGAARKRYSTAVVAARSLLTTTSIQEGMEMRHAKRVIQPLVDGAFADEPVVVGLTTLGHHDEYTYAHAVNVCIVATSMGHYLGMDRRALADLSVASLLHDVGKGPVAEKVKNPIGSWTADEEQAVASHPVEGAKLLARSTTLNQTTLRCLRVALEHHAHADGSGYPRLARHWQVSLLARLVAIADCFVSLQTHRSDPGRDVTPYEALGMMLGPLHAKFDAALLWALVQTVGFYPPGQLVELDDQSIAVVLAPNRDDLARPHVRVIVEMNGQVLKPDQTRELKPMPKDLSVRRALKGSEYEKVLGMKTADEADTGAEGEAA